MAATKAAGRARQGTPRKGRRLGIKISGGQKVKCGQIIIRQIGSSFHSSKGTMTAKDYSIYSLQNGRVNFKTEKGRKIVEVV